MILFNKERHEYNNGELSSVSSWIAKFCPEFPKDLIAGKTATKLGIDKQDVLDKWEQKKDISLHLGNWVHESIEYYLKFDSEFENEPVRHFKECQTPNTYHSEVIVHNDKLAGTIDLIEVVGKNKVVLHDFKTNEDLYKKNGKMLGMFSELDYTPFNKYRIQLSKYKEMLQEMTGVEVVGLNIWHYVPNKGFTIIPIEEVNLK
jgi:hypothetical protein